jgi:MFS family permease
MFPSFCDILSKQEVLLGMNTARRNYHAFIWHALFLAVTITFTEVNTVIPALILQIGGSEIHVGIVSAIMIGVPLVSKLHFAAYLSRKSRKRPSLITGITLRIIALALIGFTLIGLLIVVYAELLMFTLGGAFAGIAYIDLIGNSFDSGMRKLFFTRKQIISSVGILFSAAAARYIMQSQQYPSSYILLFFSASAVLFIASMGFWRVKETPRALKQTMGYVQTLRSIPSLLKKDRNLRLYLNAVGAHVALIPFYAVFAQRRYYLDAGVAANMLFIQILGMIAASLVWPRIVSTRGFKGVLKIGAVIAALLPLTALAVGYFAPLPVYLVLYSFVGAAVSAKMVSENAVIVELSSADERILYSAVAGTLNVSVILLPLVLGLLIAWLGFIPVFIGVSLVSSAALGVTPKIICPIDTVRTA